AHGPSSALPSASSPGSRPSCSDSSARPTSSTSSDAPLCGSSTSRTRGRGRSWAAGSERCSSESAERMTPGSVGIVTAPEGAPALGAVGALNRGLGSVNAEWIVVVEASDVLSPHALEVLGAAVDASPEADLVYSDEDRIVDRVRVEPFYKPAWSPDRFRCQNYVGRLAAMRRSLVDELGGFRPPVAGAHEWDLLLRVSARAPPV